MSTIPELIQRLQSDDPAERRKARDELVARGAPGFEGVADLIVHARQD